MATSQFRNLDTDTSLGGSSSSDYVVASQKAIKTYVDNHSGGGSYTAGNGISIDANNEISVTAPTLTNKDTSNTYGVTVGPTQTTNAVYSTSIGGGIITAGANCVNVGYQTKTTRRSIAIGSGAEATASGGLSDYSMAIGLTAKATGSRSIQIGTGTNADANTFKVANANGNFEIMSADGTIPEARLADTTNAQQGDVLTLDSTGNAVWQAGGGGGSVAIDDSTITKNSSDEIQAVATVNANSASGATTPIYDWVGTLEEYETQAVATNHPDWVCYIIDDLQPAPGPIRREVAERNIGELVYSLIPVQDAGLHLLDGEVLDGAGIYSDFYDYMASIASTYSNIFTTESAWQTSVTTYGACGKFVLDTTNHTIRLPKLTGFVEGTVTYSELCSLVEAGLPNITGSTAGDPTWSNLGSTGTIGCVTVSGSGGWSTGNAAYAGGAKLEIDASKSSAIYGKSSTVQPQAVKGYIYMVLANTTKTQIQVDIDEIVTDLNGKVSKGHEVIDFQEPTSANNYTWYRKYADGWVEQGGVTSGAPANVVLPVEMADTNYSIMGCSRYGASGSGWFSAGVITTTGFGCNLQYGSGTQSAGTSIQWRVSGMAA